MANTTTPKFDSSSGCIEYRGYYGSVEIDFKDKILHGKIVGISDYITYEGSTVEELENDFIAGVESYLEACEQSGKVPEKSFPGK